MSRVRGYCWGKEKSQLLPGFAGRPKLRLVEHLSRLVPPMAPPVQLLPDDLTTGILIRIPPDDPASIARSSAVCKAWRRVLADPSFLVRYRAHHRHRRTAPVLGFLHNPSDGEAPRFVPTTSFRLPAADRRNCRVLDCRHGRVVLHDYDDDGRTLWESDGRHVVCWDPFTGDQHRVPHVHDFYSNAAVVCTARGGCCCDHRSCSSGGPFIVVFAGLVGAHPHRDACAQLYSSATRRWSFPMNIRLDDERFDLQEDRPAALVGDSLYFIGTSGVLRYRYQYCPGTEDILSLIEQPPKRLGKVIVMTAEGGGLGLASLNLNRISLWARETRPDGDAGWVRRRIIDLKRLHPLINPYRRPCLSGLIPEEAGIIFISTEDGVFRIELEPLQATKISEMTNDVKIIYPFVSFYTEMLLDKLASSKLHPPVRNV